jgi:ferredoxin--NADP+ reductase
VAAPPLRVALVGAGPSGFYAAEQLLRQERPIAVDLFDRLPTPFGLVRGGVAPDHPKIKSVTRIYDKVAAHPSFRFFGNVTAGRDVTAEEFLRHYHAVIWAVGAEADRALDIPGEDLPGSHTATEFVGWYNGHPDYRDRAFDLSQEAAAVVGVGNVAMDVTRILATDPTDLAATDIAAHALEALRASRVRTIYLLGRRGPAQAAFTNPELKEFGELPQADVLVRAEDLEIDPATRAALDAQPDREAEKNLKTLQAFLARGPQGRPRRIVMLFRTSPLRIEGAGRVERLVVGANRLETGPRGVQAVSTGQEQTLPLGLVFRSVGYRALPLPGMPFDARRAIIPNERGRVLAGDGVTPVIGNYVTGWIKRGPSGVIGTNKPDAVETVACLLEDAERGALPEPAGDSADALLALLRARGVELVTWRDWQALDTYETGAGAARGAPREKVIDTREMLTIIRRSRQSP